MYVKIFWMKSPIMVKCFLEANGENTIRKGEEKENPTHIGWGLFLSHP